MNITIRSLLAAICSFLAVMNNCSAAPITYDMVTVGDPGNAPDTDPSGKGAVAEAFRIGKYEVTIAQYTECLNAAAMSDLRLMGQR